MEALTIDEQAIAEWLERGTPTDVLAERYGIGNLGARILDCFKRFVNAAYAYQNDKSGELTHRSAAIAQGIELWMYELFMSRFQVDREQSKEGMSRVGELKKTLLYKT